MNTTCSPAASFPLLDAPAALSSPPTISKYDWPLTIRFVEQGQPINALCVAHTSMGETGLA